MAYTFGAAVTDNIQVTALTAAFTTSRLSLITCWIRPTTLTATRVICASGATWALSIDTTTSSLRLTGDFVTDGVFTFPAGLALNTWTFVAVLVNIGTAPAMQVKAWTATETSAPVERTVTVATAPVGAITSGGSTFTVGNTSGGSLAFQGDIGGFLLLTETGNTTSSFAGIPADGTTSQAEADQVRRSYVDPMWRGDILQFIGMGRVVERGAVWLWQFSMSCDNQAGSGGAWTIRPDSRARSTVTGATASARRTPRSFDDQNNNTHLRTRRGYRTRV